MLIKLIKPRGDTARKKIHQQSRPTSIEADIYHCRDLVLTSLDMLVDMRSNGGDMSEKREMAIFCLDSAIDRLNEMLIRYKI